MPPTAEPTCWGRVSDRTAHAAHTKGGASCSPIVELVFEVRTLIGATLHGGIDDPDPDARSTSVEGRGQIRGCRRRRPAGHQVDPERRGPRTDAGVRPYASQPDQRCDGCIGCIAYGIKRAAEIGLSAERLLALPGWRDSALYDDAERAAFALTEAMTRLADHPDTVTDEIWAEAVAHYDEPALAALVSMIALTNFFDRVTTTLRTQ
jgi:hypothetical protein